MNLTIVLTLLVCVAAIFALVFQKKANEALKEKKQVEEAKTSLENKLELLRKDMSRAREDLARKTKELGETREMTKTKLKREALKSQDDSTVETHIDAEQDERAKLAVDAMQMQLHAAQEDAKHAEQLAYKRLQDDFLKREAVIKNELKKVETELNLTKRDLQKKKRPPQLGDLTLQLESLPPDVVSELARLYRKSEQHEQLHAVSQGKIKMSKEKYNELQKRYFAVCRELALAVSQTGETPITDEDAKKVAESIILSDQETATH